MAWELFQNACRLMLGPVFTATSVLAFVGCVMLCSSIMFLCSPYLLLLLLDCQSVLIAVCNITCSHDSHHNDTKGTLYLWQRYVTKLSKTATHDCLILFRRFWTSNSANILFCVSSQLSRCP